jgi:hypothetical protein
MTVTNTVSIIKLKKKLSWYGSVYQMRKPYVHKLIQIIRLAL